MFGFVIGMACLAGLAMMYRHRRYARYGYGRGCGPGGWAGPHQGWHGEHGGGRYGGYYGARRGGFGRGPRGMLGFLASRLEATPEQERVIRDELEQLFEQARGLRRELRLSRDDVASAMRGESFDEEVMGESFARQDEELETLRKAFVGALAKIHDVLDERQRRRLADILVQAGPPWRW